jgi:hypothetical protein
MIGFVDIEVDDDGDLVVSEQGDLKIADSRRTAAQDIIFRVRTIIGDYVPDRLLGSSIATMYGAQNTRHNGELIRTMVQRSLMFDSRFSTHEVTVDVTPISQDTIIIVIIVSALFPDVEDDEPLLIEFLLNYETGTIDIIGAEDPP